MGSWDGDMSNDLKDPDGNTLPKTASSQTIFSDFGQKCKKGFTLASFDGVGYLYWFISSFCTNILAVFINLKALAEPTYGLIINDIIFQNVTTLPGSSTAFISILFMHNTSL